jgi:outer membrane lipoprotein SlyB
MADEPAVHDRHPAHIAASFADYAAAESAVKRLLDRGVPPEHVSLVGKNFTVEARPLGFTTISGVAKQGSKFGALWGGVLGLLMGFTVFFEPASGPMLLFGPLAYALTTAVEGAVFGGLAGILLGWGLHRDKAVAFERSVQQGEYLVVVSGDDDIINRSYFVLQNAGATNVELFSGRDEASSPA